MLLGVLPWSKTKKKKNTRDVSTSTNVFAVGFKERHFPRRILRKLNNFKITKKVSLVCTL